MFVVKKIIFILMLTALFTTCEAILVEDISNQRVEILAPAEGTQLATGTITLNWQTLSNANSYHVQIATPGFTNATQILLDTTVTENRTSIALTTGTYQWRVRASNTAYATEYTTINFSVN